MSLPERVRCVVVGTGAFGSAAAYRLARRLGDEVLVLEQFRPGHTRGASEDHSRIIRHSYGSAIYTRITRAMFAAWDEVAAEAGESLVLTTGGLDLADPATTDALVMLEEIATAMAAEAIPFERLDADAIRSRWPQWRVPDDASGLFQPEAGVLDVGRACAAHLRLAIAAGARLVTDTRVTAVVPAADGGSVRVETADGVVEAEQVVLAAGKWTNAALPAALRLPLVYTHEQVTYFASPDLDAFAPERFPVWILAGDPCFYGFPVYGRPAVKAAEDLGGPEVEVDDAEVGTDPARETRVGELLERYLPGAVGPPLISRACLYELPPDRDLIVGPLPGAPNVHVAIGAGHGAKFGALFGAVLADFVCEGSTTVDVAALGAGRFGAPSR